MNDLFDEIGIEIYHNEGYCIDQNVEGIINSANNGLLLGRSGAGRIKDITGLIKQFDDDGEVNPELNEFNELCQELGRIGRFCNAWLDYDKKKYSEEENPVVVGPTYVQLECLRKLKENNGEPIEIGEAVITTSGDFVRSLSKPHYIIHAVGMGYNWPEYPFDEKTNKLNPRPVIKATEESVKSALNNSLRYVNIYNIQSLAIPIMCSRVDNDKVYGLTPEKSHQIILDVLKNNKTPLKQVIICADNSSTVSYIRNLK
jgi:O-acetyl-ADP-ribose deacetylase (regulator of RNase III)